MGRTRLPVPCWRVPRGPFRTRAALPTGLHMAVEVRAPRNLERLGGLPSLPSYARSLWQRREFAIAMSVGEMRSRHQNTVLGGLWHLINPLLLIGTYYLIFGVLLGTDRGIENFIGFLSVGIFVYQFSQRSIVHGANSISNNLGLIRSLQFPRALLPISTVIRESLALRVAAIAVVGVLLLTGEGVSWDWLLVPPVLVLQFMFNLGSALVVARLADRVRDVANFLPFVFRLLFYFSGVLFSVDRIVTDSTIRVLFIANPFYAFISLPREYLLSSHSHDSIPYLWMSCVIWAVVALVVGLIIFRAGERSYGRG